MIPSNDESIVFIYNGEIYNYMEVLSANLFAHKFLKNPFRSVTDTKISSNLKEPLTPKLSALSTKTMV